MVVVTGGGSKSKESESKESRKKDPPPTVVTAVVVTAVTLTTVITTAGSSSGGRCRRWGRGIRSRRIRSWTTGAGTMTTMMILFAAYYHRLPPSSSSSSSSSVVITASAALLQRTAAAVAATGGRRTTTTTMMTTTAMGTGGGGGGSGRMMMMTAGISRRRTSPSLSSPLSSPPFQQGVLLLPSPSLRDTTSRKGGGGRKHRCSITIPYSSVKEEEEVVEVVQQQQQQQPDLKYFLQRQQQQQQQQIAKDKKKEDSEGQSNQQQQEPEQPFRINLQTIPPDELRTIIKSWGYPQYRSSQILHWIRVCGITQIDEMTNLPNDLRSKLHHHANTVGVLRFIHEDISRTDGTMKRAYALPNDGQLIESVLMPYDDGRFTACISSQAGCAQGCIFCATGQMGFARQLTSEEIFEQVSRFDTELKLKGNIHGVTNVVMMGMGEPLANYRNVALAIKRMNTELNISCRRITISTVGIVPNIRKLTTEYKSLPIKLAISLHCTTDDERSALLPANKRYGGLQELMTSVKEYTQKTKRRITFEWALIANENDSPDIARQLGQLILNKHKLRRDYVHINLIPLNPTGGYANGKPSDRKRVNAFVNVLRDEFGISATPRVRRGIDINAGCGQLKSTILKRKDDVVVVDDDENEENEVDDEVAAAAAMLVKEEEEERRRRQRENEDVSVVVPGEGGDGDGSSNAAAVMDVGVGVGVYGGMELDDDTDDDDPAVDDDDDDEDDYDANQQQQQPINLDDLVGGKEDDFEDEEYHTEADLDEVHRLLSIVKNGSSSSSSTVVTSSSSPPPRPPRTSTSTSTSTRKKKTTTITDENALREAKRRRKKLIKNLKMIGKLRDMEKNGRHLNDEQRIKVSKEERWKEELESVEHNLQ